MAAEPRFSGAILAGGESKRMGRDKAFVRVGDRQLVEIASDALSGAGATEIFVVGGDPEAFDELGMTAIADDFPGEGPLGGIITALRHAAEEMVVILACDHVATEAPAVNSVLGAIGTADAVIPVIDGQRQTLHAAWRRTTLAHLERAFDEGARSVNQGLSGLEVVHLLDGDPCWFRDADTPDELPPPTESTRQ